jgi:hypothetical protein
MRPASPRRTCTRTRTRTCSRDFAGSSDRGFRPSEIRSLSACEVGWCVLCCRGMGDRSLGCSAPRGSVRHTPGAQCLHALGDAAVHRQHV